MTKHFSGIFLSVLLIISMTSISFADLTVNTDVNINTTTNSYTLTANAQNSNGNPISYQWYQCDSNGGNAVPISGSTGSSFTPPVHNETTYYYCAVTSTDADGNTETVTSKISEVKINSKDSSGGQQPSENNSTENNNSNQNSISTEKNNDDSDKKEIYTFSVTNIKEPVLGELPDTVGSSVGDGYSIASITWSPADHHFQPDTAYTVTVNLKLDNDVKASSNFKCLINNQQAVINGTPSNGILSFSYTFSPTKKLDEDGFPEDDDSLLNENDDLTMSEIDDNNNSGIPGWLWFILILILLVSVGAVLLSKKRRNKKEKRNNNIDDTPKEKSKRRIISEKLGEKLDEIFEDDEFDDPDSEDSTLQKYKEIRAKQKSDIKEGKILNKFDNFEEYEAMMNDNSKNNPEKNSSSKHKTAKIVKPKPKTDDNNVTYIDSDSISGFNLDEFSSPINNSLPKKENNDSDIDLDENKE